MSSPLLGVLFSIAAIALLMVAAIAVAYELRLLSGGAAAGLVLMVLSAGGTVAMLWFLLALAIVTWRPA